jgi:hypothetical protein
VFEPNQGIPLDKSDLVFLDAVGTGYSQVLGNAPYSQFWSVDGDVDSFGRAITRCLEINQRDLWHRLLPERIRRNVDYRSGHQTHADKEALLLMKKDLDQFYQAAVTGQ